MGKQIGRVLFALFLIAAGVIALLGNLNMLPFDIGNNESFWLFAFGLGGLAFLVTYLSDMKENWWATIPGFTLVGLGVLIGFGDAMGDLAGGFFLGMIGLSFWVIFLTAPKERWWALIPAGVLVSLVGVIAASTNDPTGYLTAGILFFGMAATFLLVYITTRMAWALWPAGILGIMGALFLTGAGGFSGYVLPAALILVGGWLIVRSMLPKTG